jgi:hypothetical protein
LSTHGADPFTESTLPLSEHSWTCLGRTVDWPWRKLQGVLPSIKTSIIWGHLKLDWELQKWILLHSHYLSEFPVVVKPKHFIHTFVLPDVGPQIEISTWQNTSPNVDQFANIFVVIPYSQNFDHIVKFAKKGLAIWDARHAELKVKFWILKFDHWLFSVILKPHYFFVIKWKITSDLFFWFFLILKRPIVFSANNIHPAARTIINIQQSGEPIINK